MTIQKTLIALLLLFGMTGDVFARIPQVWIGVLEPTQGGRASIRVGVGAFGIVGDQPPYGAYLVGYFRCRPSSKLCRNRHGRFHAMLETDLELQGPPTFTARMSSKNGKFCDLKGVAREFFIPINAPVGSIIEGTYECPDSKLSQGVFSFIRRR